LRGKSLDKPRAPLLKARDGPCLAILALILCATPAAAMVGGAAPASDAEGGTAQIMNMIASRK
jgi:hypothetical protein